ncbi:MAG: DUF21 domain-containing protein [Candidatus Omnitrophica bacterium]|nr:DUF21 domain-containing protein [Candidatus Omnitrophota bacterium]
MTSIYLLGCLFFILLQGFFASSEIAFISSNMLKLRRRKKKDKKALFAYQLLSNPEKFLATALVGTNISLVISSTLATNLLIDLDIPRSNLWITFLFTPVIVIFAELIPKNIGRYYREELSIKTAKIFKFFNNIFSPFVYTIEKASIFLVKLILGKAKRRSFFVTKEEIKALVAEVQKEGILERGEKEAIEEIFDFGETKLKDVQIPLGKVVSISHSDPLERILSIANLKGFTRYPVFKNKEIIGYINIFDLFYGQYEDWHEVIRPVIHVGASQKLYDVFTLMQNTKENIAVVIKGKRNLGIVTLELLIKEILNSIVK